MKRIPGEIRRSSGAILRGLGLVREAAGGWTLLWGLLLLMQGIIPAALIYLGKVAIDLVGPAIQAPGGMREAVARLWLPLSLFPVLWFAGQLVASIITRVRLIQSELVQDHIHALIHEKALSLDMAFFDSPASYDALHRARIDAISQPLALLENLGSLIQNGITLLALAVMLSVYAVWLPLLLLLTAIPGLWVMGRHILREHAWRLENTVNERRSRYYDMLLTDQKTAAELRLFDLGSHFRTAFSDIRQRLRQGRISLATMEMKAELLAGVISWTGGLGGMAWMALRALQGMAKLGDLVLCYQSFQQGQKLMRSLFESAGRIYRSTLFLQSLFEFLSVTPGITSAEHPAAPLEGISDGVRFERVSFSYPGSSRSALHDFDLTLPGGKITAIVGHNGAGKSTLIKLLCRYYDPAQGRITIDGRGLDEFSLSGLRRMMTVLFQEPVHFQTTVSENIAAGDLASSPDQARISAAARDAGADGPIGRLPDGYATHLGKMFGGAELSVGEWQRIALARAFLRNAPLVILDEPTSAMDSWAENDWLARFRGMTRGKTVLIITHRFTTAMHADLIQVMEGGQVTESGTHQQLVALGGHYAASWKEQMKDIATA